MSVKRDVLHKMVVCSCLVWGAVDGMELARGTWIRVQVVQQHLGEIRDNLAAIEGALSEVDTLGRTQSREIVRGGVEKCKEWVEHLQQVMDTQSQKEEIKGKR